MKNALLLLFTAIALFAVSAGLSIWLNHPNSVDESPGAATSPDRRRPARERAPEQDTTHIPPPAVHPRPDSDASETLRLARQVQADLEKIAKREQELEHQEDHRRLVLDDIRFEMDYLQKRMSVKGPAASRTQLANLKQPTAGNRSDAPASTPEKKDDAQSAKNMRVVTGISESMPPESAAKIVEQMARTGKLETVVQILAKMNQRQAAKILAAIGDERLTTQIIDAMTAKKAGPGSP